VRLSSLCGIEECIYNNANYFLLAVIKKNDRQVGPERFGVLTPRSRRDRLSSLPIGSSQSFSLTASALAVSQLAGILAVQAHDAVA
jgi:hypothetical protein